MNVMRCRYLNFALWHVRHATFVDKMSVPDGEHNVSLYV